MNEFRGPVPTPAYDAVSPGNYLGFYGMPMFPNVPTADLEASTDFWLRGLGFDNLFAIPGQVVHLRRWAFQDVLLKPGTPAAPSEVSISFSCVLSELDEIAKRCEEIAPACTSGPELMPWNSRELTVVTPEGTKVVMTAAEPIDPDGPVAERLRAAGIDVPRP
ncbi:VOC family protein [Amycolatopsis dendrobii]|uniref:VOC family protein n=1 Tax=Amycolatopsis dendrobii TaxID=2760662 RepID=A0A7W3Z993_9PSEU|nr:VOC family protein [Amycolatopsis dendrobii]MBB1153146.1 VOC family protein [Amycolatopsis dendrobii]